MDPEAARIEHLKLIQAVVDRQGRNSFAIKSTAAAVSAALVAFTASGVSPFAGLGGLPIVALWLLDARFLRQERDFRRLYDFVRMRPAAQFGADDYFTMDVSAAPGKADNLLRVTDSPSLYLFYLPLLILLLGVSVGVAVL